LAGERAVSVALDLFVTFLWVGSLAFGGGFGMVPLLRQAVLAHHWLTIGPFDQAIAMGQITPGPVAISATFIGERVDGLVGALAATIGVFLPSLVIIALLVRFYPKLKRFQLVKNIMAITLAAVVGLIGGVTVLLGRSIVSTWEEGVLAAVVLVVALKWKVPYWAIILASGLIGALAFR
jgi:chromate transporter